ncbi:initiation factor 2 [Cylindrobasidium torrendii FP15055 ss-10]|uniref:Translation initiation factor IF-2, mitochondrial n=1 Tax=Cylindrobasidium torrendii FP15055 ss-10 TaxID=1314674 RepID=A0A0D7B2Q9_9AGAR|nr:initiation factor 2 [Cylindrobasidium torrendii FP15055 ss-10]
MKRAGMEDDMSYDHVLTADYAALLAEEYNYRPIFDDELGFNLFARPPHPDPTTLPTRPPIVTIMGHVDHGKTTLLDTLRSTAVAKGEAGGITQHIGAFSVPVPGGSGSITFLDTPGHAAFSAMRARGAQVTDIIVLVVAADDGVMPQTREVLELIKKDENVSVIVAVNKVDKPGADADKVKRALMAEGLELEDFGGEIPSVEVSGLTGKNLPALVETLSAVAEMKDIRAERDGDVNGFVLEAKVSKGLGSVATVLVTRGCLKPGSHILAGCANAKVRSMADSAGKPVKEAFPGMAVTVSGWKHLPTAGDEVLQGSESDIKKALSNRERKADQDSSVRDVDAINEARRLERERRQLEEQAEDAGKVFVAEDAPKGPMKVKLLIKADVSGSAEAVSGALHNLGNDAVKSQVISAGVGDVSESDILTAKAAKASVVAFSVKVPKAMELLAHREGVPIMSSPIIYRLVDSVTDAVRDKLPKVVTTTITGEANVLQIFEVTSKGKTKHIAGSRVTMGLVQKKHKARVMRNGEVVYEGNLETMRVLKNDVTEIRKGSECGLALDCADLKPGDTIQCFTIEESLAEL